MFAREFHRSNTKAFFFFFVFVLQLLLPYGAPSFKWVEGKGGERRRGWAWIWSQPVSVWAQSYDPFTRYGARKRRTKCAQFRMEE